MQYYLEYYLLCNIIFDYLELSTVVKLRNRIKNWGCPDRPGGPGHCMSKIWGCPDTLDTEGFTPLPLDRGPGHGPPLFSLEFSVPHETTLAMGPGPQVLWARSAPAGGWAFVSEPRAALARSTRRMLMQIRLENFEHAYPVP
jgi:hypothetical protein